MVDVPWTKTKPKPNQPILKNLKVNAPPQKKQKTKQNKKSPEYCFLLLLSYSFRVFHTCVCWWFFTGQWVRAIVSSTFAILLHIIYFHVNIVGLNGVVLHHYEFFTSVFCWWFFTGDWVTASLLKSPGFVSVFWPFSVMLLFGWSPPVRQLSNPPGLLIIL